MRKLALALILALAAGCVAPKTASRRTGLNGPRVSEVPAPAMAGRSASTTFIGAAGQEPSRTALGRPEGASIPSASPATGNANPAQNSLPLESGGHPSSGQTSSAPAQHSAVPLGASIQGAGKIIQTGAPGPAASSEAQTPPASSEAPSADAAANGAEEAAPPPMSGLDKDAISKLLNNRLDIGGYRVQIAANDDFSDGKVLFDKSYDVMEDINLFDEFKAAGVNIDQGAYWVRIAFIDLLQIELPWTKPRLYGLNKRRIDAP